MLARVRWALTLAVFCAGLTSAVRAQDSDIVSVTVTGEGTSEEAAKKEALRKALEEGGRVEITSHSEVANFELIRDTIYSRAEGIVTDYQIVEKGPGANGTYFCKIVAKVSKSAIATTWGEVQNVLDQLGRPAICVFITERIDGKVQDSSILESRIEEMLIKAGFDVYSRRQLDAIAQKEMQDAVVQNDVEKVRALAKRFATQIYITGSGDANYAGVKDLYGEATAMYNCAADVRAYYTSTGKAIASESVPNWRGGARGFFTQSLEAGKTALSNAGQEIVAKVYDTVMRGWATQISAGAGEVRLEISGIPMGEAIKLKLALGKLSTITTINGPDKTGDFVVFRIRAKGTAYEFAEQLVQGEFADKLEIDDIDVARIQAKWKK